MEPDNYESVTRRMAKLATDVQNGWITEVSISAHASCFIASQIAGVHDALIRLEATLRMIGVQMQERHEQENPPRNPSKGDGRLRGVSGHEGGDPF